MPTAPNKPNAPVAEIVAIAALLLWALLLVFSPAAQSLPAIRRVLLAAAALWHLLSFYLWLVPRWRHHVIEHRGPLLGIGFAFGAAFVGAAADAFRLGAVAAVGLFFLRLLVYSLPFSLPLIMRLPPRPHAVDWGVVTLSLLLPRLPGFDGSWFSWPGEIGGGLLHQGLSPGSLGAPALLATYFYGVRPWTAAPLDLRVRPGDGRTVVAALLLACAGAWMTGIRAGVPWTGSMPETGSWVWLVWLLSGAGLAALFEELAFRGLVQAGLTKRMAQGRKGWSALAAAAAAATIASVLHATYGPFGMSWRAGLGFSLGIGLAFTRSNRYFPAALAHALGLLALPLLASAGLAR